MSVWKIIVVASSFISILFWYGMQQTAIQEKRFQEIYMELTHEKTTLLSQHAYLEKQLALKHDAHWKEDQLINRLGLVPEGSTKVIFGRNE